MSNRIQKPFSDIIGEKSPIQKMLQIVLRLWELMEMLR